MNHELEKKHHVSYCGLYCHICDWHTGRIRRTFRAALDMLNEFGFNKLLEDEVDRDDLTRSLDTLANSSICPGCKQGISENPEEDRCAVRSCCSQKGFDLCSECTDCPCEILRTNPGVVKFGCLENLAAIKQRGIEEWLNQQWRERVRRS